MSDSEHEYVLENDALRAEVSRLRDVALRGLRAAIEAQDSATDRHDEWLDTELLSVQDRPTD